MPECDSHEREVVQVVETTATNYSHKDYRSKARIQVRSTIWKYECGPLLSVAIVDDSRVVERKWRSTKPRRRGGRLKKEIVALKNVAKPRAPMFGRKRLWHPQDRTETNSRMLIVHDYQV